MITNKTTNYINVATIIIGLIAISLWTYKCATNNNTDVLPVLDKINHQEEYIPHVEDFHTYVVKETIGCKYLHIEKRHTIRPEHHGYCRGKIFDYMHHVCNRPELGVTKRYIRHDFITSIRFECAIGLRKNINTLEQWNKLHDVKHYKEYFPYLQVWKENDNE